MLRVNSFIHNEKQIDVLYALSTYQWMYVMFFQILLKTDSSNGHIFLVITIFHIKFHIQNHENRG